MHWHASWHTWARLVGTRQSTICHSALHIRVKERTDSYIIDSTNIKSKPPFSCPLLIIVPPIGLIRFDIFTVRCQILSLTILHGCQYNAMSNGFCPNVACDNVQDLEVFEDMEAEEEAQSAWQDVITSSPSVTPEEDILEQTIQNNSVEVSDGTDKEYRRSDAACSIYPIF